MCLKKFYLLQSARFLQNKPGGGHELRRFISFYTPFSCWSFYVHVIQTAKSVRIQSYVLYVKQILSIWSWRRYKTSQRADDQQAPQHYPSLHQYLITSVSKRLMEELQLGEYGCLTCKKVLLRQIKLFFLYEQRENITGRGSHQTHNSHTYTAVSSAYVHTCNKNDVNEELFLIFDILYFDFRTPTPFRYFKIYILYINILESYL